ncbi:transglycosylase [Acinetobacter sp. SFD]|uniref:lytic transglycosylase domain-containing protein n=1 Tax=Acinetobacter sp. SFD TaxID=1805635 RepID=UPI0007D08838|nr:transglycosylase SLT domain-containing protein [Acinetobacter sp. SFD]OAL86230.1 transglycosylase [Acinetobacter sp. SFD]
MFFSYLFNPAQSQSSLFHSYSFKFSSILLSTFLFAGCSSLGGGSIEKRAAKLSKGIQTAYSTPADTANRVSPLIVQHAQNQGVDPLLIAAVIRQESTYRSQATSPAGAVGLMQVIPRYWQQTCPGDLYSENSNIQCGTYILAKYTQSSGNWKKALAYYNVGPSGYENNRKMRKQGKRYAKQVKQHKKILKNSL